MIRVAADRRTFEKDGKPFFWLADTAWELFHRPTLAEALHYLDVRAAQGFNVVQAVALAESDGLRVPNANGDLPFEDLDPARPVEAYWTHVDRVVAEANARGITVALLPTWGDKWRVGMWGTGPVVFDRNNARAYGEWIGRRYADADVVWVLGGDRPPEGDDFVTMAEMAAGVRAGDGGSHLVTFHPMGGRGSSEDFADAAWLDFDMWQSGHGRNTRNWEKIAQDHARGARPTLDGEPGYEDHMAGFDPANGYLDDYDNRKAAYWATFAGAAGHTYGCHPIWQFWDLGREPYTWCRRRWQEAIHLPGATQMRWVKDLILAHPGPRVPADDRIEGDLGEGTRHRCALRAEDDAWILVYLPLGEGATVRLPDADHDAFWYDPRRGTYRAAGVASGDTQITPPAGGPDWVWVGRKR